MGTGDKGAQVGSPAENGGEPQEVTVGLSGRAEAARRGWGCFGVLTGTQPGSLESLSWEEVGKEEREDERNVQEFQSP